MKVLRTSVDNTSHIKTFFILCIQFVLCMDWIYELKKVMSPRSIFHNLTLKFSAFYKFSKKKFSSPLK